MHPDTRVLMDICGIDPADMDESRIQPGDDYEMAPVPDAAKQVLEKVHGDPLPRKAAMASILRRILPPRAITDTSLLDSFASIRNTIRNPRGLSATNLVAVSSVPEFFSDPESLGVDGVGKTTLAAMVAHHADVRRFFLDGVIWIYIGQMELNYTRYTQCLRELLAQLYLEVRIKLHQIPEYFYMKDKHLLDHRWRNKLPTLRGAMNIHQPNHHLAEDLYNRLSIQQQYDLENNIETYRSQLLNRLHSPATKRECQKKLKQIDKQFKAAVKEEIRTRSCVEPPTAHDQQHEAKGNSKAAKRIRGMRRAEKVSNVFRKLTTSGIQKSKEGCVPISTRGPSRRSQNMSELKREDAPEVIEALLEEKQETLCQSKDCNLQVPDGFHNEI
ncbi:Kinesin light chain [Seminavis robusta]|uniref:Kinesin light chain n=1 Tax=Seminavis robusta TaxID=568900 RepID=A0A9N8H3D8_9STRA|nr:Kinesin light chain [Seminavis robusta]|eukprot:Sro58_g033550.1 Kinesin light chain (386) ;mRNA; r:6823-8093